MYIHLCDYNKGGELMQWILAGMATAAVTITIFEIIYE